MYKYDIALSYAGEQKAYVSRVCRILKMKGLSVFFADDQQEELTGIDMTTKFYDVFHNQCFLIAAFVSDEYLKKDITMHEATIGKMRSREEKRNCLIPVYFGEARLPDFNPDINYLSAKKPEAEVAYYLAAAVELHKKQVYSETEDGKKTCRSDIINHVNNTVNFYGNSGQLIQAESIKDCNIQYIVKKEK